MVVKEDCCLLFLEQSGQTNDESRNKHKPEIKKQRSRTVQCEMRVSAGDDGQDGQDGQDNLRGPCDSGKRSMLNDKRLTMGDTGC
jgi:hypothetical protein